MTKSRLKMKSQVFTFANFYLWKYILKKRKKLKNISLVILTGAGAYVIIE
jgi:hypothetical protein